MKITDAVWEKRNLGVDVTEITCTPEDTPEALRCALESVSAPYSVVKVPAGCMQLLQAAQEGGYRFAETTIAIEGSVSRLQAPAVYARFLPHIRVERADDALLEKALREIASGETFTTDRIALDPHYSREIAGHRYYNWCRDVLEDGGEMAVAFYKDRPVCFNLSRRVDREGKVFDGLVGGTYAEASRMGLGFMLAYNEVEYCRQNGGSRCLGRVSSNNPAVLRMHMQYGFSITGMSYVLTRHLD